MPGRTAISARSWRFRYNEGKFFMTVETNLVAGPRKSRRASGRNAARARPPVWLRPDTNQTRALIAFDKNFGPRTAMSSPPAPTRSRVIDRGNPLPAPDTGWIDFAVYSKPGPEGTGQIEIFANGKWIVTVKGPNRPQRQRSGRERQYFKFGPYRAGGAGSVGALL